MLFKGYAIVCLPWFKVMVLHFLSTLKKKSEIKVPVR